ncbi:hypothetical protein DICPUDRAFT_77254 [Dictyostelium purpureum]|uniref:Uncharacterized protein n=1 Tax=Dictyostelium purpureum TaxID=5786 RepID=F0ZG29_DICPU|nr:uncharacterized protein DICPUDRAFT_77254 [Dictyostelium purpureum]EGC37108.1 hypothetical protein DICPUDRAFT_77254 [Dictyostelium purpureum]|eukprot:XP_003286389.1 hypothetical protein DICPUDRAFT_77254 [Dictyostelium purpureum]
MAFFGKYKGIRCTQKVTSFNQTNFEIIVEKDQIRIPIRVCESGKHFKDIAQTEHFFGILREAFFRVGINSLSNIDMNSPNICSGSLKRGGCANYVGQHLYIYSEYFNSTYYYCGPSCLINHLGNVSTTKWRNDHKNIQRNNENGEGEENNPNEGDGTDQHEGNGADENEDGTDQHEDNGTGGERGRNGVTRGGGVTRGRGRGRGRGGSTIRMRGTNNVGTSVPIVHFIENYCDYSESLHKKIVGLSNEDLHSLWEKLQKLFIYGF